MQSLQAVQGFSGSFVTSKPLEETWTSEQGRLAPSLAPIGCASQPRSSLSCAPVLVFRYKY